MRQRFGFEQKPNRNGYKARFPNWGKIIYAKRDRRIIYVFIIKIQIDIWLHKNAQYMPTEAEGFACYIDNVELNTRWNLIEIAVDRIVSAIF